MKSVMPHVFVYCVFFVSGVAALIYQLVWQRSLMMIYGTNTESVAMVVSSFLVGLGLGSIIGGRIAGSDHTPHGVVLALIEFCIGTYGLLSLTLFDWVAERTIGAGTALTGVLTFSLVFIPTTMMGITLPLLVGYQLKHQSEVGASVSNLYFANTLGAGLGAFAAAFGLLGKLGLAGCIRVAAGMNLVVALAVICVCMVRSRRNA
jgi:predicted membrane-bound spermidine synthase